MTVPPRPPQSPDQPAGWDPSAASPASSGQPFRAAAAGDFEATVRLPGRALPPDQPTGSFRFPPNSQPGQTAPMSSEPTTGPIQWGANAQPGPPTASPFKPLDPALSTARPPFPAGSGQPGSAGGGAPGGPTLPPLGGQQSSPASPSHSLPARSWWDRLDWQRLKPWWSLGLAVIAAAVLVTALLAPGRVVPDPVVAVVGETTVGCPVGDPVFGATTVTGVADQLTWSTVGGTPSELVNRFSVTDPAGVVEVTGDQSMGVLTTAVQHDRLVGLFCAPPSAVGWWDGVWVTAAQQSALMLSNLDETTASVTVTVIGETGPIPVSGLRQIPINRFETRTIDLNTFFRDAGVVQERPVSIALRAETGRVVASLRSQGELGQDWRQTSVAPAADLVIPGVPNVIGAGEGSSRLLFITNRGDATARVQVLGLGSGGTIPVAGAGEIAGGAQTSAEGIVIRPQTTTLLDLTQALSSETMGLVLHSLPYQEDGVAQPLTASLVVTSGNDMASVSAQPAMAGGMRLPVVKDASLVVTNPGQSAARLVLTYRDDNGTPVSSADVEATPGTVSIPLTAEAGSVDLSVEGSNLRVALVIPQLGATAGLLVAPLGLGGLTGLEVALGYDPSLG